MLDLPWKILISYGKISGYGRGTIELSMKLKSNSSEPGLGQISANLFEQGCFSRWVSSGQERGSFFDISARNGAET